MKGELKQTLEMRGFLAAGHAAGNMPMGDRLAFAWGLYDESKGNMFVNFGGDNQVFTAPKILVKNRNYT